jgi:ADP-heptose:LPS heptosyltransferase
VRAVNTVAAVGTLQSRFDKVERIAFLRGGGLGDLIGTLPAAESLAAAYPGAAITLLGTPLHAALLEGRPSPFADVAVLPASPGVRDGAEDPAATAEFVAAQQDRCYDLAVQVHGGGRNSNPFLLRLGARHTVGTRTADAPALERNLPYVLHQHEGFRALEVVGLAGAPPVRLEPEVRLTAAEATRVGSTRRPRVALHPGATDPRRRWPAENFAALAVALATEDREVVVVGDPSEADLAAHVVRRAHERGAGADRVWSQAGRQSLSELVILLAGCALLVANDSGPRHLAAALGTPTASIYWFSNVISYGPLSRGRHRVQLGWTTHCPVCRVDSTQVGWTAERCPHDDSFVADVSVEAVLADACALLTESR